MIDRPEEGGFTLIEVMISLALFALIGVAGVAMVEGVLRVQAQTGARLERLGDVQRAMFVVANDLGQVAGGPVSGTATRLTFSRRLGALGEPQPIDYRLAGDLVIRDIGPKRPQRLLTGVAGIAWRYYLGGEGWFDHWPPDLKRAGEWPSAIAVDVALTPVPNRPGGTLHRLVVLPGRP